MMISIQKILSEKGGILRYEGVAPEGFILIHENTLEELKNFDTWKDWKNNLISIESLNNKNVKLDGDVQSNV